uniref:Uncharacterized protein n=2 Tax=Caenorhabditis japonica TaxID=281687 RepID=A0A8R1IC74_CAEJA
MSDESYADLDLDSSYNEEEQPVQNHVIGPAPTSSEDDEMDTRSVDSYMSGESDYDLENATPYIEPSVEELAKLDENLEPELPEHLIAAENYSDDIYASNSNEYVETVIKYFLPAAICSTPLLLRNGFSPDEVDKCLTDEGQISLEATAYILLGARIVENLPNKSKTEFCHALVKAGWLTEKQGKFFPVLPESEKEFILELIDGAENTKYYEERKKKEAEQYPSEEAEIRAHITFNFICELLSAVQRELQQNKIKYQTLSTEFEKLVSGQKNANLFSKYKHLLDLESDAKWDSEWFKKYTNRSSLKKFVTMPKFAAIVADQTSEFRFRTDNVHLFTNEDLDEVRQRWRRPAARADRRWQSGSQNAKSRENVPDPDYRPAAVSGGISALDEDDDGSLRPTTSSNHRNRHHSPTATIRDSSRTRPTTSSHPARSRSPSITTKTTRTRRDSSENPPPEPLNMEPAANPFGGPLPPPARAEHRPAHQPPPPNFPRTADYAGYSSTEDDITSDGSYTDEKSEEKERRRDDRQKKLAKKQKKLMERQNAPPKPPPDNSRNRFRVSSFAPVPESPTPPPPAAPAAPPPLQETRNDPDPPPSLSGQIPLTISESRFDEEDQARGSIPFRPMPTSRPVEDERAAPVPPVPAPQPRTRVVHPDIARRQRDQNESVSRPMEPGVPGGFRGARKVEPAQAPPPPPPQTAPPPQPPRQPHQQPPPPLHNYQQFSDNRRGSQDYGGMNGRPESPPPIPEQQHHYQAPEPQYPHYQQQPNPYHERNNQPNRQFAPQPNNQPYSMGEPEQPREYNMPNYYNPNYQPPPPPPQHQQQPVYGQNYHDPPRESRSSHFNNFQQPPVQSAPPPPHTSRNSHHQPFDHYFPSGNGNAHYNSNNGYNLPFANRQQQYHDQPPPPHNNDRWNPYATARRPPPATTGRGVSLLSSHPRDSTQLSAEEDRRIQRGRMSVMRYMEDCERSRSQVTGYDLRSAQHNGEVHIGGNENIIAFIRRYMSAIVGIGFGRDANGQEIDIFYVIQD